ncbi:MAG: peptidoglycan DD-metalloendopeptidase family protein, partial [Pseudomonadota bacterium]|nr:peptidoglycan DD-metalloendopeptidase family protein [Pseudomonadota bacterium]
MLRRAVFVLTIAAAGAALAQSAAQTSSADLERINAAIAAAEKQLAASREKRGTVATEIEASEQAILDTARALSTVRGELAQQQQALVELRDTQLQLAEDSAAQQRLIANYARSAWMSGNEEYLKLLLNQDDPQRSARVLRYYRYFSEARAAKLATFRKTQAELVQVEADIEAATATLAMQQDELEVQQQQLAAQQQERQTLLARLDADLTKGDAALEQLEMDKIEIELLLQELQSSSAEISSVPDQEPFASRKGQLNWPLDGPHINRFGTRHTLGDLTWEGVTIGAQAGADVRAIHHGRVVFADWFTTSGLLLIIDHGDGFMSLYAHNQELYRTVGEWVAAGDVIAAAGNTGGKREAGLYFEIRRNGRAENPASWC